MKTLTTKKLNIAICWNNLRIVPPREFPTLEEMKKVEGILASLEKGIGEFVNSTKEGDQLTEELILTGNINTNEGKEKREKFIAGATRMEKERGDEVVNIEFENDDFNTLFQQFERWGKNWFTKVSDYLVFREDLNTTNAQPKDEIKKKK